MSARLKAVKTVGSEMRWAYSAEQALAEHDLATGFFLSVCATHAQGHIFLWACRPASPEDEAAHDRDVYESTLTPTASRHLDGAPDMAGCLGPRQGFVLVGPALHFWYQTLGRVVTATGSAGAIQRLMMDQLLFAPFFLSTFLASLLTLEVRALGAGAGPGKEGNTRPLPEQCDYTERMPLGDAPDSTCCVKKKEEKNEKKKRRKRMPARTRVAACSWALVALGCMQAPLFRSLRPPCVIIHRASEDLVIPFAEHGASPGPW